MWSALILVRTLIVYLGVLYTREIPWSVSSKRYWRCLSMFLVCVSGVCWSAFSTLQVRLLEPVHFFHPAYVIWCRVECYPLDLLCFSFQLVHSFFWSHAGPDNKTPQHWCLLKPFQGIFFENHMLPWLDIEMLSVYAPSFQGIPKDYKLPWFVWDSILWRIWISNPL